MGPGTQEPSHYWQYRYRKDTYRQRLMHSSDTPVPFVKYIRSTTLLQLCVKEENNGTIYDYINELAGYDLLVLDDFGLMELDMDKCRYLFEVIETRDSRKSTIIVSQFPVLKWWDLFQENTYADAVLSRMTKQAYRLECNGRDMRQSN